MPSGGARAGAGRKPKRQKYSAPINKAEKRIADRLPELIDNLFELAAGVTVQDTNADGTTDVYTRPPDRQANEYLLNRILGKPTERQEIAGEEGGPLKIVVEYADGLAEASAATPEPTEDPPGDPPV